VDTKQNIVNMKKNQLTLVSQIGFEFHSLTLAVRKLSSQTTLLRNSDKFSHKINIYLKAATIEAQ